MTEYYVVLDGDRIDGPFESREAAKARADELTTNEVGLQYAVEAVDG